jgi:serine/threonine protein kinase
LAKALWALVAVISAIVAGFGVFLIIGSIIVMLTSSGNYGSMTVPLFFGFLFAYLGVEGLKKARGKLRQSGSPSQPSVPKPLDKYVTFIINGLPKGATAVIVVDGQRFWGSGTVVAKAGRWVAEEVRFGGDVYLPSPPSGHAKPGNTVLLSYVSMNKLQQQQKKAGGPVSAPSRPTFPTQSLPGLDNWDPQVWVGRSLGVYKVTQVIGEGGMSYVLKGEFSGKEVAIKVLKVKGGKAEEYFEELFKEASNLRNLSKDPHVVQVYAVDVNEHVIEEILKGNTQLYLTNPPMIVMEFMKGGSLNSLLKDDTFFYSSSWEKAVYKAVASVAEALAHIHKNGYVHMDVKPQNILLDRALSQPSDLLSAEFKLGDLGSAIKVNSKPVQLTTEYAPPESLVEGVKPYMDVFALGMTLYVLLTRKNDRPDLQEMDEAFKCYVNGDTACVTRKVNEAKAKLANWLPSVNPQVDPLLRRMLSPNPLQRPSAKEVADYLKRLY